MMEAAYARAARGYAGLSLQRSPKDAGLARVRRIGRRSAIYPTQPIRRALVEVRFGAKPEAADCTHGRPLSADCVEEVVF